MHAAPIRSDLYSPASRLISMGEAGAVTPLILLVEDDARVREFVSTALSYALPAMVIEAASARAALQLASTTERPIDVLISDIDLGDGSTGIDVARELAAEHGRLAVVLMSGRDRRPEGIPAGWKFLPKPFLTRELVACVEELWLGLSGSG